MSDRHKEILRHTLIVIISILLITFFSIEFRNILMQSSKDEPPAIKIGEGFSPGEEAAFHMYKSWTQSLAQITILLFGAIWGFTISQKIIFTTKRNWSLWIAFLIPNICFSFEHILYTKALGRFIEMFFQLDIIVMEKGSSYFYLLPDSQALFFLYGILTSIAFVLLVLYFKKKEMIDLYRNLTSIKDR